MGSHKEVDRTGWTDSQWKMITEIALESGKPGVREVVEEANRLRTELAKAKPVPREPSDEDIHKFVGLFGKRYAYYTVKELKEILKAAWTVERK